MSGNIALGTQYMTIKLGVDDTVSAISANEAAKKALEAAAGANEATGKLNTAIANTDTAIANTNTATSRANTAAATIEGMTTSAHGLPPKSTPTATISTVSGHKHIDFGLVKGDPYVILGEFATPAALQAAITSPSIGDQYYVGAEPPRNVYRWNGTAWVDDGVLEGAKGEDGLTVSVNHEEQVDGDIYLPASKVPYVDIPGGTGDVVALDAENAEGLPLDVSVEVVAKQNVTAQGKNLADTSRFTNMTPYYISLIGNKEAISQDTYVGYVKVKPGATYTASKSEDASTYIWLNAVDSSRKPLSIVNGTGISISLTTPEDCTEIQIAIDAGVLNFQLEEGSAATPYEPFTPASPSPDYPAPIVGVSTVDVIACGKNHIPPMTTGVSSSIRYTRASDGALTIDPGTASGYSYRETALSIPLPPGTYTLSLNNTEINSGAGVNLRNTSGAIISGSEVWTTNANAKITFTTTVSIGRVRVFVTDAAVISTPIILRVQLEEGSAATPYEPYNGSAYTLTPSAPLYGLEGAQDKVSNGGDVLRKTRHVVLTGDENWTFNAASTSFLWIGLTQRPGIHLGSTVAGNIVSSDYKSRGYNQLNNASVPSGISFGTSNADRICIRDDRFDAINDFKAHLAARYTAGNPIQALYELATPIIESLTPVPIPAQGGRNTVYSPAGITTVGAYRESVQEALDAHGDELEAHAHELEALATLNDTKLNVANVANNLTTTPSGYALDARQGKVLNDALGGKANSSHTHDAGNITSGRLALARMPGEQTPLGLCITNTDGNFTIVESLSRNNSRFTGVLDAVGGGLGVDPSASAANRITARGTLGMRVAAGQVTISSSTGIGSAAVSFPAGTFTDKPLMFATLISSKPGGMSIGAGAASKDAGEVFLVNDEQLAFADNYVAWFAVQIT